MGNILAKVRAEIERRRDRNSKAKRIESALEDNAILSFIDSLPKVWHSKDELPEIGREFICLFNGRFKYVATLCKGDSCSFEDKDAWAYLDSIIPKIADL